MKKTIAMFLMLLLLSLPAMAADRLFPGNDVPDIADATNAIYAGALHINGRLGLLYHVGSDDLKAYIGKMEALGYKTEQNGAATIFKRSDGYDVSLLYLPETDEFLVNLPNEPRLNLNYLDGSLSGLIDPASLCAFAKRLDYNSVQNIFYYAMRPCDMDTYIASMIDMGYKDITPDDSYETVLRNGREVVSIRLTGPDRYASRIMTVAIASVNVGDSDAAAAQAALERGALGETYYQGNSLRMNESLSANVAQIVKVYAIDDRVAYITRNDLRRYLDSGWFESEASMKAVSTLIYSADGRSIYALTSELDNYKAVGWDVLPPIIMYAADGRTLSVLPKDIDTYLAAGWYLSKMEAAAQAETVPMYAADGRSILVAPAKVEAYLGAGWDTLPPVLISHPDGSTLMVLPKDVPEYEKNGWSLAK